MPRPPLKRFATLLALLLVAIGLLIITRKRSSFLHPSSPVRTEAIDPQVLARFSALEARENQADETVWAKERRAEELGYIFDSLWGALNQATNKLQVLASFPIREITIPKFGAAQKMAHDIEAFAPEGREPAWSQPQWQRFLAASEQAGWRLEQLEFRQRSFETNSAGDIGQSRFYFRADVTNASSNQLATLEGDLVVDWMPQQPGSEPSVQRIDATQLSIRSRSGAPPFRPILVDTIQPIEKWVF